MSCLYLYAVAAPPAADLHADVRGFEDRPVRWQPAGDLVAAVARLDELPPVDLDSLIAHDRVVRLLAEDVPAILPMRFGQALSDPGELAASLERAGARLRAALAQVRGCRQMTLRIFGDRVPAPPTGDALGAHDDLGPGARYLASRGRRDAPAPPVLDALAPLLGALSPWTRSQRMEAGSAGSLLGSVYHLVSAGDLPHYARALEDRHSLVRPLRVRASGPWLPYAFASGASDV